MPVEDHPKFPEWKQALENMLEAKKHWDQMIAQHGEGSPQARSAKSDHDVALDRYHSIADEV